MAGFYARHDSQDINFRDPFGAVCSGTSVVLRLYGSGIESVLLEVIYFDGKRASIPMDLREEADMQVFETTLHIDDGYTGLINYYFVVYRDGQAMYYGNSEDCLGGEGRLYPNEPPFYQITVYKDFKVPEWYREGIVYQIFVDRFLNGSEDGRVLGPKKDSFIYATWEDDPMYIRDSNGEIIRWEFFGGNLEGVIKKLDYLKSLGVTAIYLNPVFEASSNHKYDTADYKKIDPMFGDEEVFKKLCHEAYKRDIRIILDGVFSHTGADSVYFNKFGHYDSIGAYQSKESPYFEWYRFVNYPEEYESWWGIKNLPNVNEMDPSYIDFIISGEDSVIKKWMQAGAWGWRLDVADELPDEFIELIKKKAKEIKKDSILIGEVWEDASNKVSYSKKRRYLFGNELDSVTNYPFREAVISFLRGGIDSSGFARRMMSLYENYPLQAFYSNLNLLGSHDTERILTVFEDMGDKASRYLKLAVAVQMTFPGVPVIYYGDEAGLKGGRDPDNRRTYPWGREDQCIQEFYRELTSLRSRNDVFKKGGFRFYPSHEDAICYERFYEGRSVYVVVNRNEHEKLTVSVGERGLNIEVGPLSYRVIWK